MTVECDVAVEHLVAYSEGSLRGARLEVVEAHVQACPVSRSRLTDFQHADRMLRAQQVHDDVSARRALMQRVEREAERRYQPPWGWRPWARASFSMPPYTELARNVAVALIILIIATLYRPELSAAAHKIEDSIIHAIEEVSGATLLDTAK